MKKLKIKYITTKKKRKIVEREYLVYKSVKYVYNIRQYKKKGCW